jgi:hypothetical protein
MLTILFGINCAGILGNFNNGSGFIDAYIGVIDAKMVKRVDFSCWWWEKETEHGSNPMKIFIQSF